jgi:beta propeller repeat protein
MDKGEVRVVADNGAQDFRPSIDGDLICYESTINGNMDVFVYQLSTGKTFQVTTDIDDQYLNDIFGNLVAYVDMRYGNEDIYVESLPPPGAYWWPMFHHGQNHNGYTLSPSAPSTNNTLWTYLTGGLMWGSPTVAAGRVYIGSDDGKVYCLNASNGAHIWNYTTGWFVRPSPAVANGKVYVGSDDRKVYCLNATTGAFIWNCETGNAGGVLSCSCRR